MLSAGTRLGPYEIVGAIGVGGMGEVYRARDTKLQRDVAIKILPEAFAGDAERVARFAREAQVLASLNHPHIAAVYGLQEAQGSAGLKPCPTAIVMELVEGTTLAERLAQGSGLTAQGGLPLDEALEIARQIVDALEAAHDKGIIHRDLKPANVALTADGQVKVLDFGLAKALESDARAELANSPLVEHTPKTAGRRCDPRARAARAGAGHRGCRPRSRRRACRGGRLGADLLGGATAAAGAFRHRPAGRAAPSRLLAPIAISPFPPTARTSSTWPAQARRS